MVVLPLPRSASRLASRRSVQNRLAQSHVVQWRTASPLWSQRSQTSNLTTQTPSPIKQPAILRFTTDRFMEDFLAIAQNAPQRISEWQAQWESWRKLAPTPQVPQSPISSPAATLPSTSSKPTTTTLLKLYQPAHQRYYLLTANLVCRVPGFPDKTLKIGEESVSFVLRRVMEAEKGVLKEHAFINEAWQPIDELAPLPGEERFPLFPTTYQAANNQRRRMFAGLIPVGERERYLNAPRQSVSTDTDSDVSSNAQVEREAKLDRLMMVLTMDVLAPWQEILAQVGDYDANERGPLIRSAKESFDNSNSTQKQALRASLINERNQLQLNSWYVLLDLARFLQAYLPDVWSAIESNNPAALSDGGRSLYDKLISIQYQSGNAEFTPETANVVKFYQLLTGITPSQGATSLAVAMLSAVEKESFLESTTLPFDPVSAPNNGDWPETKFLLTARGMRSHLEELSDCDPSPSEAVECGLFRQALAETTDLLTRSIPQIPQAQAVSSTAKASDRQNTLFTIRCVYERPNCPPSIYPTVVSDPTEPFELAAYYDPDAPTRPIRIPMPIDTTPAGLRKYAKNTAFIISDTLDCQISQVNSVSFGDLVRSVLPWPFHKDLDTGNAACRSTGSLDFGKMLTLSIPIITLCALLLLMMIVKLLDMIFRWVPFFLVWLPIPGIKAKEDT